MQLPKERIDVAPEKRTPYRTDVKAHCRRVDIAGEFVVSVVTVLRNVCQRAVHLAAQDDNQERSALGATAQTAEAT